MAKNKPITGDLNRVYTLIPKGKEKPVTSGELSQITGMSKRRIREIINLLIMSYDIPIAGARGDHNHGYYIITNEEERVAALMPLVSQQNETAKRISKITRMPLETN